MTKTMKKKYIAPKISERALVYEYHILSGSGLRATFALSRESNTWDEDDEEEETEDSMWK